MIVDMGPAETELLEQHKRELSAALMKTEAVRLLLGFINLVTRPDDERRILGEPSYGENLVAGLSFDWHAVSARLGHTEITRRIGLIVKDDAGLQTEADIKRVHRGPAPFDNEYYLVIDFEKLGLSIPEPRWFPLSDQEVIGGLVESEMRARGFTSLDEAALDC